MAPNNLIRYSIPIRRSDAEIVRVVAATSLRTAASLYRLIIAEWVEKEGRALAARKGAPPGRRQPEARLAP
jgi:hypothetical protein